MRREREEEQQRGKRDRRRRVINYLITFVLFSNWIRFVYEGEKHLSILSSFVYKSLVVFKKLHFREITIRERKKLD